MIKSAPWTCALLAVVLFFGCKKTETVATSTASADSLQTCPAPASWFPSTQTKEPNPLTFPDSNTATNCDFHQWSWQMFLWLTQTVDQGDLRFMTFPSGGDLFKSPTTAPLAAMAIPKHRLMQLRPRSVEPEGSREVNPDAIAQAGSGGVLVGPNGRAVYYSVHFDSTFYEFVRRNKYYDYDKYIAANPNTDFPPGALEIKASWRILSKGEDAAGAYTTDALVPQIRDSAGSLFIDHSKPMLKEHVALIGVHVVGVVAHHPEFIWATFEHITNAPDLPYGMDANGNKPVSSNNFTFYKANTPADSCNQLPPAYSIDPKTQVITPISQVFRQFAWGDTAASTQNTMNITMLNKSVHTQLEAGSMLKSYDLIGAVWLLPGALHPNMKPKGADLHGSPKLANATMETFVQGTDCFSCHTTTGRDTTGGQLYLPPMNMNLSHVLVDGLVQEEHQLLKLQMTKKKK